CCTWAMQRTQWKPSLGALVLPKVLLSKHKKPVWMYILAVKFQSPRPMWPVRQVSTIWRQGTMPPSVMACKPWANGLHKSLGLNISLLMWTTPLSIYLGLALSLNKMPSQRVCGLDSKARFKIMVNKIESNMPTGPNTHPHNIKETNTITGERPKV